MIKKLDLNKKAILLPEVLKIIIAVVCIVLLIYLAVKLYGILTASSDLEKARATLNAIVGKMSILKPDESIEYIVTGPINWLIVSFGDKLCVCPPVSIGSEQESFCKSQGVCSNINSYSPSSCRLSIFSGERALDNCIIMGMKDTSLIKQAEVLVNPIPFTLYIYQLSLVSYFGLIPYTDSAIYGHQTTIVETDSTFAGLIKSFIESSSKENEKAIIDMMAKQPLVIDAASRGFGWAISLDYTYSSGALFSTKIYSKDISAYNGYTYTNGEQIDYSTVETDNGRVNVELWLGKYVLIYKSFEYWQANLKTLFDSDEFSVALEGIINDPVKDEPKTLLTAFINNNDVVKGSITKNKWGWALVIEEGDKMEFTPAKPYLVGSTDKSFAFILNSGFDNSNDLDAVIDPVYKKLITLEDKQYTVSFQLIMDSQIK